MILRSVFAAVLLLAATTTVLAYKLSPDDGQADIGAYHVQPGRCAGVERRLGRTKYDYFFHSDPFLTSFSPSPSSPSSSPPSTKSPPSSDTDGAGSGIEQMDATSLCAFNPELTEGYGGGFDKMKLYLVYSRCLYGTDSMRVLCGTTDGRGKPTNIYNLVQASCPQGTKCKNLCATMQDPSLTSPFAAKQVQLAQCMPTPQWQKLTDMYKPKTPPPTLAGAGKDKEGKTDPKVVDKPPQGDPTKDQTHVNKDGTIPGKVLPAAAAPAQPKTPPKEQQKPAPVQPQTPPKEQQKPAPQDGKPIPAVGRLQTDSGAGAGAGGVPKLDLTKPSPPTAANPMGDHTPSTMGHGPNNPILPPEKPSGQKPPKPLPRQKAPTPMGF